MTKSHKNGSGKKKVHVPKSKQKKIRNYLLYVFGYSICIGFLYGTSSFYFPTDFQVGLLYFSMSWFWITMLLFGLSVITYAIFHEEPSL